MESVLESLKPQIDLGTVYDEDIVSAMKAANKDISKYNTRVNQAIRMARATGEDREFDEPILPYVTRKDIIKALQDINVQVIEQPIRVGRRDQAEAAKADRQKIKESESDKKKWRRGQIVDTEDLQVRAADLVVFDPSQLAAQLNRMMYRNRPEIYSLEGTWRSAYIARKQQQLAPDEVITFHRFNFLMTNIMHNSYDGYIYNE